MNKSTALSKALYLIDTNALRKILKGDSLVSERFEQLEDDSIFLSIIAVRETIRGITDQIGQQEKKGAKGLPLAYSFLDEFLQAIENFQIHPYTESADAIYQNSTGKGAGPGQNDWRIAASAVSAGMVVVTADKGFGKIQEFAPELIYQDFGLSL